jgi:hypothetical protein
MARGPLVQFVDGGQFEQLHLVEQLRRHVGAGQSGGGLQPCVAKPDTVTHAGHDPLCLAPHEQNDRRPVLWLYLERLLPLRVNEFCYLVARDTPVTQVRL